MLLSDKDFSIAHKEAELLFGKSKKQVEWAILREKIKARQALNTNQWFISYQSCVALWGQPVATNLVKEITEGYHG